MYNTLDAVKAWLENANASQTPKQILGRRQRQIESADDAMIPTPGSSARRTPSPSKKRRADDGSAIPTGPDPEEVAQDADNIGTSRPFGGFQSVDLVHRLPPPTRPLPSVTTAVSASRSGPTQSRPSGSPSRSGTRSRSPTKRPQHLDRLEKPVRFGELLDNALPQLPQDVTNLWKVIQPMVMFGEAIYPDQVATEVTELVGMTRPSQFYTEEQARADKTAALEELDAILAIRHAASTCLTGGHSESSWNLWVHHPLLALALSRHTHVAHELATTARILPPFLPSIPDAAVDAVSPNMIDFVLVLRLHARDHPGRVNNHSNDFTPADSTLRDAIRAKVNGQQPFGEECFNQTAYEPLRYCPIAVSIETKRDGNFEEGRVQLAVWTAAWHKRMAILNDLPATAQRLVTLPLLLVVDHEWKLLFACDRGECIVSFYFLSLSHTCDTHVYTRTCT